MVTQKRTLTAAVVALRRQKGRLRQAEPTFFGCCNPSPHRVGLASKVVVASTTRRLNIASAAARGDRFVGEHRDVTTVSRKEPRRPCRKQDRRAFAEFGAEGANLPFRARPVRLLVDSPKHKRGDRPNARGGAADAYSGTGSDTFSLRWSFCTGSAQGQYPSGRRNSAGLVC